MSVTVKMGNAKNEFERYSGLGDPKKQIKINSLVGILKVFKAWDFLKKHIEGFLGLISAGAFTPHLNENYVREMEEIAL